MDEPIDVPVTDLLDLHAFAPRDVPGLVATWLDEAVAKGFVHVRIIHGKGSGALRETVHALLRRSPHVAGFRLDGGASSWGATIVQLRRE